MLCQWEDTLDVDERGWRKVRCTRCGRLSGYTPHPHERIFATCRVLGWGDYVSLFLALFGITKGRANAVARRLGFRNCRCRERQERVNRAGEALRALAAPAWSWVHGLLGFRDSSD
jgi:hypothetical protein